PPGRKKARENFQGLFSAYRGESSPARQAALDQSTLDHACGFQQTHNSPRLVARDRTAFRDFNRVAFVVLVGFIMRFVLVRAYDDLAKDGVFDAALDANHDSLVHLVADHLANEGTLALGGLGVLSFAHFTFLRSQS